MTHLSERVGSRESPTRPRARARTGSTLRSQSLLWRRPIGRQTNDASGTFLDEAIALGMVLRQRHIHLAESLFDRVHHHVQPADGFASTWTTVRLSRAFSASSSSRKVIASQSLLP